MSAPDDRCSFTGCGHVRIAHIGHVCLSCESDRHHPFLEPIPEDHVDGRVLIAATPIPMLLHCPMCSERHIDKGEFATKPHATHACQFCGHVWKPALVDTVGVQFLPGYKSEGAEDMLSDKSLLHRIADLLSEVDELKKDAS